MGRIDWHGAKSRQRAKSVLAKHIGQQLLKARQRHQMTMRQVADAAGLSNPFVCQIENGQSIPTAETLWKLSRAFGCPVGYWFRGYGGEDGEGS